MASSRKEPATTPWLSEQDIYLFNEGTNSRMYQRMGAHLIKRGDSAGCHFAVWAPSAEKVSVVGDFNDWHGEANYLEPTGSSGIWSGFVPGASAGQHYKYRVWPQGRPSHDKADPYGFAHETPPKTASIITPLDYQWNDAEWMETRGSKQAIDAPMSIYEVHLGSWMQVPEDGNRSLSYREAAVQLADYCTHMGFTHVELLPITEHPFGGSWGYQVTGFFAPTARFGPPEDFMFLVDTLHQAGIGIILDWVPGHFPNDAHGLAQFDGTHLYEHADPKQGFHPDWNTLIFNYGRHEVRSFLLSSAHFWLDRYHLDGLRVDGVASMLYLDYSRNEGEWIPNQYGGRENLEAISFLRQLNETVYGQFPDVQTIAEESTAWPMVSRPVYLGGLGFGFKWDMGWMHDTLEYMKRDPIYRQHHHGELTFRGVYAWHENFVLPLSHDEVVHGKGSLWTRMPGDPWQKLANLRLLYGYMFGTPGKKLLFMGDEIGQEREWNHDTSIDWHVLSDPARRGLKLLITDLNRLYRTAPALHQRDCDPGGFQWIDSHDAAQSVLVFSRHAADPRDMMLVVCNFTPIMRENYRVGVDIDDLWLEVVNTDSQHYGGAGIGNYGEVEATPVPWHGRPLSLNLTLPPLSVLFLAPRGPTQA